MSIRCNARVNPLANKFPDVLPLPLQNIPTKVLSYSNDENIPFGMKMGKNSSRLENAALQVRGSCAPVGAQASKARNLRSGRCSGEQSSELALQ